VLRGKLIRPAFALRAAFTLLEDAAGDLVRVTVYNAMPGGLAVGRLQLAAQQLLPEGATVAVVEPFFKVFADGTLGVRIDDPRDLLRTEGDAAPRSALELKEQGNAFFRAKQPAEAAHSYTAALAALEGGEARALSSALCNWAAALLAQPADEARTGAALCCAAAASAVDGAYAKARFRAAVALERAGDAPLARWCGTEAQRLGGRGADCAALLQRLSITSGGDERAFALAVAAAVCAAQPDAQPAAPAGPPAADDDAAAAAACKARGNELHTAGEHAAAAAQYGGAVRCLRSAATLLCNRAACAALADNHAAAAADAAAALTIDPSLLKAQYRLAAAVSELGKRDLAQALVERALRGAPGDVALQQLRTRLADEAAPGPKDASIRARMPADARGGEAEEAARKLATSASVAKVAKANQMMDTMRRFGGAQTEKLDAVFREAGLSLDAAVPPYATEFSRAGRWPAGCDMAACRAKLVDSYEHARAVRMGNMARLLRNEQPDMHDLVAQRLRSTDPAAVRWLLTAPLGDVRELRDKYTYDARIMHSFSNAVNRREVLAKGTTHVAVGFVDLGGLREAMLAEPERAAPLRWVGYEASPFCVAKTTVIAAMLVGGAPVDAVLQVWYSAAWSRATHAAFRAALEAVLARGGADTAAGTPRHPDVAALLQHWRTHDVPLATARKRWLEPLDWKWCSLGDFKQEADRMALCAYVLTGQLLPDADVGSVTMFALPAGYAGVRALNESFFHCLDAHALWERREAAPDIVAAGVALLRDGIAAMQGCLTRGDVRIELRLAALEPGSAAVRAVAAMQPYTMSWSNVCDYFSFADFHALARACSAAKDTVHYAYSMNWPLRVKGASSLDFQLEAAAEEEDAKAEGRTVPNSLVGLCRTAVASIQALYAADARCRLLHCRPTTTCATSWTGCCTSRTRSRCARTPRGRKRSSALRGWRTVTARLASSAPAGTAT
jgi:tetratricopeptide (TPR) repeat protein